MRVLAARRINPQPARVMGTKMTWQLARIIEIRPRRYPLAGLLQDQACVSIIVPSVPDIGLAFSTSPGRLLS